MKTISHKKITSSIALFAIFLSFMAQITPLWAKTIDGQTIVICSSLGEKTIFVDKDGNESPTPVEVKNHCLICLTTATDYIAPTKEQASDNIYISHTKTSIRDGQPLLHARTVITAHSPRAPPRHIHS